jgi:hypothetical protein
LAHLLAENVGIWHKFGTRFAQLGKKLKRILINYI